MSMKSFLSKTKTKAANSAGAFLKAHRDFLESGELAALTSPILAKVDSHETLPTPALKEITSVVFAHMMAASLDQAEKALVKAAEPKVEKPYEATIRDSKGVAVDDDGNLLVKGFERHQDAEGWIHRRLIESSPDCKGEIAATKTLDSKGHALMTYVTREESFARLYAEKKMASHKKTGVSMSKLGFGVKAKNDRFHFSHG